MKTNFKLLSSTGIALCFLLFSCSEKLTDANINPNGVAPETGNPNLTLPTVMAGAAQNYMNLGFGKISGVMQHTQEDGWYSGFNFYDWAPEDWSGWYGLLRNNQYVYDRAVELDYPFHQGVALTMKSFMFGVITDLWGDAPYTDALKAGSEEGILYPAYDSQETIYKGIIEDLKTASSLFAGAGDISNSYADGYDVYFNGNVAKWQKFVNSLLLRYYLRVSDKMPEIAKPGIEAIYASGIYMKNIGDDAMMSYIGTTSDNSWPQTPIQFDASQSNWRRRKAADALMSKLNAYHDPRRDLWFQPVHAQWVADPTLATPKDQFIRKNGVILPGVESYTDQEY
ncbi:MAG TPA: SusD/RagB family nutrient-binding outer membrane lipoprotein, partial [Agriterribacter sp.]|nr:SusD/RagB family nutrient-binding outer membrane lipoprotein [Agriterribacter sp.]